jgi:hypothetical protein
MNISFSDLIDLILMLIDLADFIYKVCKDKKEAAHYSQ